MTHLRKFVSSVPEYRRTSRGNFKHKLEDILMLVILGRLSKCINRAEVPCTTTGVTLILYLHTHSVRALLWLLMFAKRKVIKSVPRLLDKLDVSGCIVTADAMSFQKVIIDKIRDKGADFVIELKANQKSLRYGLEDSVKTATPTDAYKEGPYLEHGRIESRICRIYRGEELIVDREKWNGNLTVIEILTSTEKKSDGRNTSEQRLYISSLDSSAERLSQITKQHWAIESMHWNLDRNLRQDSIKRKAERAARNLDTIQRMVLALIDFWKNRRKKISDKKKGTAQIIRELSVSFTNVLHFLAQK